MSQPHPSVFFPEPERYELRGSVPPSLDLDRRAFFRLAGAGVVVALLADEAVAFQPGRQRPGGAAPKELGAWLHVGEDSVVTVFTGKVEVGQNIRTSLTQVVADELRCPPGRVRLVMRSEEHTSELQSHLNLVCRLL